MVCINNRIDLTLEEKLVNSKANYKIP